MIEFKGLLKNISALDSNVFILVTESGKHVGDLTLTDDHMLDKIDTAMAAHRKKNLDKAIGPTEEHSIALPITLVIRPRIK